MMMGPDPMMRIFEMSVRFGMLNSLKTCHPERSRGILRFAFAQFHRGGRGTRGPSPLGMTALSGSRFEFLHHLDEILKQIMRIMRSRRSLGVILHAEQWHVAMAQAFQRVVVQVDVRQFHLALRQRVRINGKVMVVGGDLDLAALQLLYRMIPTMVAEFKLEGFSAKRQAGELMSQA